MSFLKITAFLVLGLLLAVPAQADDWGVQSFTLDNGLQVVVIPNHRAPVVTHMIWYKFGGADEKPGVSGVAHFLEHLLFKGTPSVPGGQFSAVVKKLGGNDNAFTTHDYTAFYQSVPRDHLAQMMEMEADRMTNLVLKESEVLSERQVIIEERRQRIDNQPQAKFQEQMMSALFVNHPYGTPVIGWLHEMKKLTREDALEGYHQWYAPNNAIVVVSGDITAAELKPMAEKYYGGLKPSVLPPRRRPEPAPIVAQHRIIMEDSRIGLPVVAKSYRVPHGNPALEMLTEIFGGSSTSRLYRNLVVEQKLAVSAGADYDPVSLDDTTLTLYASPTPGVPLSQLEAALDSEIRELTDKGVTVEELKSAKSKAKAELLYAFDSLQGPANLFGRVIASGFGIDYLDVWGRRVEKMTVDDVNGVAKTVFSGQNLPVTGLLLPQEKRQPVKGGEKG